MSEHHTHGHHPPAHKDDHEVGPRPQKAWKPIHHDWRFWVGAVLVTVAMFIYVVTEDLAWRPHFWPSPGDHSVDSNTSTRVP